jgi:hypothetical protein
VESIPTRSQQPVLLLGAGGRARALTGHVLLLGYRAVEVEDVASALRALAVSPGKIRAGLIPSMPVGLDPVEALDEVARASGMPLAWVVFGGHPDPSTRTALRNVGARHALFDPFTEEELRFVLNQVHYEEPGVPRSVDRVPTRLRARVTTGTGERVAIVYDLSTSGAYLATPRPAMRGGSVELRIGLPEQELAIDAEVMWNNVPGNLRRSNAPVGMGVRFRPMPAESARVLEGFVAQRVGHYRL